MPARPPAPRVRAQPPALTRRRGGPAGVCPGALVGLGVAWRPLASPLAAVQTARQQAAPGKTRMGPVRAGKGGGRAASLPGRAPRRGLAPTGRHLKHGRADLASRQAGAGRRLLGPRGSEAPTSKPPRGSAGADWTAFDLGADTPPARLCTPRCQRPTNASLALVNALPYPRQKSLGQGFSNLVCARVCVRVRVLRLPSALRQLTMMSMYGGHTLPFLSTFPALKKRRRKERL